MPTLLRDNAADARVAEDLAALASAYNDDAVAASVEAMRNARNDDFEFLATAFPAREPEDSVWERARNALIRYRLYAAAAAVFLAIIVFMSPVPLPLTEGFDADTVTIPTGDSQRVTNSEESATAPAVSDVITFDFAAPGFEAPAPSLATPALDSPSGVPAATPHLQITQSGYASTFGGTPAEQEPPGNGLPAESIAGAVTKYSFLRLSGSGRVLKLKRITADGAAMNADEGRVQLCQITTAGWKPARAERAADAPAYNDSCIGGQKAANGVWSFTFSELYDPSAANGWAIVPVVSDNKTFRLTFAPTAA